jgi:hypothetical protein
MAGIWGSVLIWDTMSGLDPAKRGVTPDPDPIGANLSPCFDLARSPSPCPLPPWERVFGIPSLDGRGKGEGDKMLKSPV